MLGLLELVATNNPSPAAAASSAVNGVKIEEDFMLICSQYLACMWWLQELGGEPPMGGPEPQPRDRRGLGHHGDRRDAGPPGSDPCHLYVGYIAAHVTDQMLEGLFRSCGEVLECQIVRDKFTQESKGFGFVRMATEQGVCS